MVDLPEPLSPTIVVIVSSAPRARRTRPVDGSGLRVLPLAEGLGDVMLGADGNRAHGGSPPAASKVLRGRSCGRIALDPECLQYLGSGDQHRAQQGRGVGMLGRCRP